MRINHHLAGVGVAAAALAACSPAAHSHDKAYYATHAPERATTLAACRNDPGELAATPSCVNAQAADADAYARPFDVQPPVSRLQHPGTL
jgi:hypothetical protein